MAEDERDLCPNCHLPISMHVELLLKAMEVGLLIGAVSAKEAVREAYALGKEGYKGHLKLDEVIETEERLNTPI